MNKKKLAARGVFFGYAAIGTQMLYSFASIPLALSHLTKAEFGMWSLITTLASYLSMAELGITNAFMRHLFECKDGKDPQRYGRLLTACMLSQLAVALFILLSGIVLAFVAAPLLKIPGELSGTFIKVMLGQVVISAAAMASRIAGGPLYVHHRQDLSQISQIGLFVVWYFALYLAFRSGLGIYSMLVNQAVGFLWVLPYSFYHCRKNGYYPAKGTWGLPGREEWFSVLRYSRDQFIIHIGGLVLMGLPQILISRLLGLEMAATWAVCSRPFAILRQIVTKPFDVTLPMLYDQFDKGEMKRLTKRWVDISQLVIALSGCVFVVAAANNSQFIELWTHGKIHWEQSNNWMLAFYFMVYSAAGVSFGIIGLSKNFGRTKFVPLFQAVGTLALAVPLAKVWGLPGLILGTTIPFVLGMIIFGVRYLATITGQPLAPLAMGGLVRPTLVLPLTITAAWGCTHLAQLLPGYFGFALSSCTGFILALAVTVVFGVSREVGDEIRGMLMRPIRRFLAGRQAAAVGGNPEGGNTP